MGARMQSANAPSSIRKFNYLDFELEIGLGSGREYPISVVHSPAGEARGTMRFPYDELALENRLLQLQNALLRSGGPHRGRPSPEQENVRAFGQDLFNALLTDDVRSLYYESRRVAEQQGKGLRLKLRVLPPDLAVLPWEFLYDPRIDYVCLSLNTPIIRYLEVQQPIPPLSITPPLRILGMTASPSGLFPLDIAREKQRIEKAVKDLQARNLVQLTWLQGQTWRELQREMRIGHWHILHFIGHGGYDRNADEGYIALADEDNQVHRLSAAQLARLLDGHHSLRFVLLNACEGAQGGKRDVFSSTASILVRQGVPAVLAMQYGITDRAAIELARSFYEALADGLPVDAAVVEARRAISIANVNTVEWGTPVLYMRSPDGILFNIEGQQERLDQKRTEADRLAAQKDDAKRAAHEKAEQERLAKERAEAKRLALQKAEAERIAREQAERLTHTKANGVSSRPWLPILLDAWNRRHLILGGILVLVLVIGLFAVPEFINRLSPSPSASPPAATLVPAKTRSPASTLSLTLEPTPTPQLISLDNLAEVKQLARLGKGSVEQVAWSPDSKTLAVASSVGLYLYDAGTLKESGFIDVGAWTTSLAFSPVANNKRVIAAGSLDNILRLWDADSGQLLHTLEGHTSPVVSVVFSPDGGILASGSSVLHI